ncbi:inactive ubiquitin thioesterase OTULINL [Pelodytes ibericus]
MAAVKGHEEVGGSAVQGEMSQRRHHKLHSCSELQVSSPPTPGVTSAEANIDQRNLPCLHANLSTVWNTGKQFLAVSLAILYMMWQSSKSLLSKWCNLSCKGLFQMKRNPSINGEVNALSYCAKKWKGEALHERQMRKAYDEVYNKHHFKSIRLVKYDNYSALRAVLFQVFSQGIPFPTWMKEKDVLKLPEKLLYSQGCNWIQQFSFGPERYAGPKVYGKLRKCIELFKNQWMDICNCKDQSERHKMCKNIFSDDELENKLYEAVKFIMLYLVIEAYENMKTEQNFPSFFNYIFSRESSSDPLSFMMNTLNCVGDSTGLEQIYMFLVGFSLEVKIKVFRLAKVDTEDFEVIYQSDCKREWHEICLVTENDRHYDIPVTTR